MTNSAGTAILTTLAFVLASAAVAKLLSRRPPAPALTTGVSGTAGRLLPVAELLVAASVIIAPAAVSGPVLAAVFAGFAVTHVNRWRAGREQCDCFGAESARAVAGPRPLLVTAASAVLALAAGLTGAPGLAALASRDPAAALVITLVTIVGAYGWRLAFSARPRGAPVTAEPLSRRRGRSAGDRLVSASALFLERRLSRRTMLLRVAVAGSALTVAPLRYLLYPGSALAVIAPGNCPGGACDDGYTGFCCEINDGLNTCPENTFPGGWWMCTDYAGRQLCSEQGVRYYVDCNALPHVEADGGCHCGGGNCGNRRIGCNVFRYGQCNTHIPGITPVVCRMVVCENPSSIPALNCSGSVAVDNAVCDHEAPCLEPRPRQLAGAGGV